MSDPAAPANAVTEPGEDSLPGLAERPTGVRYGVLAFLASMAFILYLDRGCINQAAPIIKKELGISETQKGIIFGAFALAYLIFEIPAGWWGDRYGSRRIMTRIVVWWSLFTALTGAAWGFGTLLVIRFLFGAGEAGALPNSARVLRVVSRFLARACPGICHDGDDDRRGGRAAGFAMADRLGRVAMVVRHLRPRRRGLGVRVLCLVPRRSRRASGDQRRRAPIDRRGADAAWAARCWRAVRGRRRCGCRGHGAHPRADPVEPGVSVREHLALGRGHDDDVGHL